MSEISLEQIASISGKPGLYKIISPARQGVIVESLDERKKRMAVSARNQVSVLSDISLYALNQEGTVPLPDVLYKIYEEFGDDPGVTAKDTSAEHYALLKHVLPEYDADRIFPSDVKKLVSWYHILLKQAPELLTPPTEESEEAKEPKEEAKPEAKKTKKKPQSNKEDKEANTEKEG